MEDIYTCPGCGGEIDLNDIDVSRTAESSHGEIRVPHVCPHCGWRLTACYDVQHDHDFICFELNKKT